MGSGLFSPPVPMDPTSFFLAGFAHPENIPFKKGRACLMHESVEAISSQGRHCNDSRAAEEQRRRPSHGGPGALPDGCGCQHRTPRAETLIRPENGAVTAQRPGWKTKAFPPQQQRL